MNEKHEIQLKFFWFQTFSSFLRDFKRKKLTFRNDERWEQPANHSIARNHHATMLHDTEKAHKIAFNFKHH